MNVAKLAYWQPWTVAAGLDLATIDEKIWWYTARSGGIVALVLVAASVLWGLFLSTKYLRGGPKPKALLNLHRFLGGLSVVFTGLHLLGLWLDSYIEFSAADLFVPFASEWKPAEVAAGVVAFWLLLAVQGTSMLMKRLPRSWWKAVHATSFLLLPLGFVHGATAGSDVATTWYQVGGAGMVGLLTWMTIWKVLRVRPSRVRAVAPRPNPAPASGRSPANPA
jgi:DMSO/TMAO reductase YedYZ heme-binding membrane subunit